MTQITAPFSAPPNILGIGGHRLEFVDGTCTDPGLNDGERAYLLAKGYRFTEDAPKAKAPAKAKATAKAKAPADPVEAAPADPAPATEDIPAADTAAE